MIRKTFFWLHLAAGCLAGIVIFIMSFTGVAIAFQRQIIHWSDRSFRRPPAGAQQERATPEQLLASVVGARQALPTTITIRSDPAEPASAEFGRSAVVYLDPATGRVLGPGSAKTRAFFREVENWHRWLAAGLESRATARGITGACNLIFLGILLSGFYLWLPKAWSGKHVRPAIWFRRGLAGKARDWNWHNTIGIWCVLPLIVIVASGVVMSYPWANAMVYQLTGSEVPKAGGGGGRAGVESGDTPDLSKVSFAGIDAAWRHAETQVTGWKTIGLRVPSTARAPLVFTIDAGDGGRPDLRSTLTLKRGTGEVVKYETFNGNSPGRRLRPWIRFSHTGEAGGLIGVTVAAIASLGACFLVGTGLSLAIRRLWRAVARRRQATANQEVAA